MQTEQASIPAPLDATLDGRSIARGAFLGFAASVLVFALIVALRHRVHGFADSGAEASVSLLMLVCYVAGGYCAVGSTRHAAGATGALAGIGAGFLGIVLSLTIWLIATDGPLFTGQRADHPEVALLAPLVFGAIFGAAGGTWAARRHRASPEVGRAP